MTLEPETCLCRHLPLGFCCLLGCRWRQHLPTIYAVLMQSDFAPNHEYPIMAIAVDTDDELMILPDFTEGYTNLGDYTKEQILALDDWMKFSEGYITINVTLYNICELIEQYVK